MIKTIGSLIIILLLGACTSANKPETGLIETAISQTLTTQPGSAELNHPTSTNLPDPTNTPRATSTTMPIATPTETQIVDITQKIAKNYVASNETAGVMIEVVRVLFANKTALEQDFSQANIFDDKPVIFEVMFRLVNNTGKIISIYLDQGTIAVNNEQINMTDYIWENTSFGDNLGGDFLPGVTAIGGIWMGLKRTKFEEINKITIIIGGAHDQDMNEIGEDFTFEIPVQNWTFEPIPEELK